MPAIGRRALIQGAMAGALWPLPMQAAEGRTLNFKVSREGEPIGHHRVRFGEQAERLIVEIEISLLVTFAFIPVYRYRHTNREIWAGGRLIGLDSMTDDDGTGHWVSARADRSRLLVESSSGARELAGDTLPTSYWHDATVTRDAWLNTQDGTLVRATVEPLPPEPIVAAGRTVEARRYRLAGELDCELWYHEGRWSKLRFAAPDGSTIDYELEADGRARR